MFACILVLCAVLASQGLAAEPLQTLTLRHPDSPATAGGGNSYAPVMSPDGRYVLFASTARNLALATNNLPYQGAGGSVLNVYWRDRLEQRTVLVTPGMSGTELGNNNSLPLALSTNGLLALIESTASNLVPNDTNFVADIFVRDLARGETILVSAGTNDVPANGASRKAVMTPDGRYVAFTSEASDLVANDTNNVSDVFLRDLQTQSTILVSTNLYPSPVLYTNLGSDLAQITADGGKVAFVVNARNRTTLKSTIEINVREVASGTTFWASKDARAPLGLAASAEVNSMAHVLSEDGAFVAYAVAVPGSFISPATILRYHLDTGETDVIHRNGMVPSFIPDNVQTVDISADGHLVAFLAKTNSADSCVLVWDASTGVYTLASANLANGLPTAATCQAPSLDPLGRWVSFMSTAKDLVTNTLAGDYHLYQRDLATGTTALLDMDETGAGWPLTSLSVPVLSADGRFVAFECVRPEFTGTGNSDIYVVDRESGASEVISRHAAGFASATAAGLSFAAGSAISDDGRFIAFSSDDEDIVADDANGFRDVIVRDLQAATNLLVSANSEEKSGNGASFDAVISGSGLYVAFSSAASDLVAGDNNSVQDVFVRDLQTLQTALASIGYDGAPANSNSSLPLISYDGRHVLFRSFAGNLAQGALDGEKFFIRDMQQGANFALTMGGYGSLLGGSDLTPDGRYAAYSFRAGNGLSYVSVWDTEAGKAIFSNTIPAISAQVAIAPDGLHIAWLSNSAGVCSTVLQNVSTGAKAIVAESSSQYVCPRFSGDNRWLVFNSVIDGRHQLHLHDIVNNTNLLVSRSSSGAVPAAGDSDSPSISPDGRFVAYRSFASDIVSGDSNDVPDVFLFDRTTGETLLISSGGGSVAANGWSGFPCFSSDGRIIMFSSWASNLHPLDFNEKPDLFAYTISFSGPSFYLQAVLSNGNPTLIWPTVAGKTYRVQFKDDLSQADWQDAPGAIHVAESQCTYTDPAPTVKRFFRIVEE